jgi:hypothetical protein
MHFLILLIGAPDGGGKCDSEGVMDDVSISIQTVDLLGRIAGRLRKRDVKTVRAKRRKEMLLAANLRRIQWEFYYAIGLSSR